MAMPEALSGNARGQVKLGQCRHLNGRADERWSNGSDVRYNVDTLVSFGLDRQEMAACSDSKANPTGLQGLLDYQVTRLPDY